MTLPAPLRFLADALTPVGGSRERTVSALRRGDLDWAAVFHHAGQHLVTPSLAGSLRRQDLFTALPIAVAEYLEMVQALNRERNRMLYGELVAVARRLNGIGIEPLLLKGAIALLPGEYPGAEDRMMGDLDILVPAERLLDAYQALRDSSYTVWAREPDSLNLAPESLLAHHHGPALYHTERPVRLELHHAFLHDAQAETSLRAGLAPHLITLPEGVRVMRPDLATRLLHNMLHTQIQDQHHSTFTVYLRPLLEFVQLWTQAGDQLELPDLRNRLTPRQQSAFCRYILLAERVFHLPPPATLERAWPEMLATAMVEQTLARPRWHRLCRWLPRLRRLPRRLLSPSWYPHKLRELRAGKPW